MGAGSYHKKKGASAKGMFGKMMKENPFAKKGKGKKKMGKKGRGGKKPY
jgi:hypothetical protein